MTEHDLVPYVGTGLDADPFQPAVEPGAQWSAIDLRPAGTRRDGWRREDQRAGLLHRGLGG
jgi:hypothetical protein